MEEFIIEDNAYRVKQMNAIEVLAVQSQYDFDTFDTTYKLFNTALEKMEVRCGDKWLPVKEAGRNIYYPAGIENNISVVKKLISKFTEYIKSVFPKSNG